jgi:hypothetical protein
LQVLAIPCNKTVEELTRIVGCNPFNSRLVASALLPELYFVNPAAPHCFSDYQQSYQDSISEIMQEYIATCEKFTANSFQSG